MTCNCAHCLRINYIKEKNMQCLCGFNFADAGEFRNCKAFVTKEGKGGLTCPKCDKSYLDGEEITLIRKEELTMKRKKGEALIAAVALFTLIGVLGSAAAGTLKKNSKTIWCKMQNKGNDVCDAKYR